MSGIGPMRGSVKKTPSMWAENEDPHASDDPFAGDMLPLRLVFLLVVVAFLVCLGMLGLTVWDAVANRVTCWR